MIDGIRGQLSDVRRILEPVLTGSRDLNTHDVPQPDDAAPATVEYLHYLYRDWGDGAETNAENERAIARLLKVEHGGSIGRTLVLGAGACRLAYDLHMYDPAAEIVVIDIDPLLFSAARSVTRGDSIPLREANLEICEMEQCSRDWVLRAPKGPVDTEKFHFVVADGVDPPFEPGSVDTVVTPWFVDQGPDDVRDFVGRVYTLLAVGGRWLNLGPLLYEPHVPIAHRFGREELFDLAIRSGFRIDRWDAETEPYLVSQLNGRGKLEWILAFAATKLELPVSGPGLDIPPPWLLFGHLPIPTFAGQKEISSNIPAVQMILSSIDGRRTLDDVVKLLAHRAQRSDVPISHIQAAVRDWLMEIHPGCRLDSGQNSFD